MKFKIKHEQKWILFTILAAGLLFFIFVVLSVKWFSRWLLMADIAIVILTMMLYFTEQLIGTSVRVGGNTVTIKYIFHKRIIAVSDISDLNIEAYQRIRRRGGGAASQEKRMRMTISLLDGKDIILTDKAEKSGFALTEPEKLPDSEVPLYKAYTAIKSLMK